MKFAYDASYFPPIPVLSIRLYSPVTDRFVGPFQALVDSGSDATLVPLTHLQAIGAEESAPGWLIGITGHRQPVSLYFVDDYFDKQAFPGIRVMADKTASEVILGRDVLNKLPLFLDGPQQQTALLDDAIVKRLRSR